MIQIGCCTSPTQGPETSWPSQNEDSQDGKLETAETDRSVWPVSSSWAFSKEVFITKLTLDTSIHLCFFLMFNTISNFLVSIWQGRKIFFLCLQITYYHRVSDNGPRLPFLHIFSCNTVLAVPLGAFLGYMLFK